MAAQTAHHTGDTQTHLLRALSSLRKSMRQQRNLVHLEAELDNWGSITGMNMN